MGSFKDIWDIGKDIFKITADNWLKRKINQKKRKNILHSFSPEFVKHPNYITDLIDYYSWHENNADWNIGSGRLLVISHKEILRLWTVPNIFSIYEAFLIRFINCGGSVFRIFVLGAEFSDPSYQLSFIRVLYRHYLLNFKPHIATVLDLKNIDKELFVDCEMFATLNDRIVYFLKFPHNQDPLMVRSTHNFFINIAVKCQSILWEKSEDFETWYKKQKLKLTKKVKKEIENECLLIHEIARHRNVIKT